MQKLKFFDCNCSFGMRAIVNPGSFYKMEDLLDRMDRYGIDKALVWHSMAKEYNPAVGNEMLMEEIKQYPELVPVWSVMHHHTGEFPHPEELIVQLRKNGVKAVNAFPAMADFGFSLAEWNCGELLSALEKYRIPFFIGFEQTNWNELHEICSNHPDLPVVFTNVNYRIDRNLYAMFKKFDNLYIETYGYKVHHGIEEICATFGARRLIYGSGMPVFSGSAAVTPIIYARISQKEKEMIARENLEGLLGGVRL